MVRLLTKYNRKLNEKVFVLTGEEDYARTTETLLEMLEFSDTYSDLSKYRLGFKINVLRDKGDSTFVTLYDRDEVLGVFDWSQDYGNGLIIGKEGGASSTNPLNHGYDMNYSMEHDFYVKFSGNKKCLPSESAHIDKYVEATNETRIDWLVNPESATDEGTLTVDIGLICGDLTLTRNKPIKFYIDDVYDGTSDTNEESVAEYTFTNIEGGHHTIKAVFEGDETLLASENSYQTMSGYKLTFVKLPSRYIEGQNVSISVLVTDYNNNPSPYAEVGLYDQYNDPLGVEGIADENGIVDLVLSVNSSFKAKLVNGIYESELFEPVFSVIDNLTVKSDSKYAPTTITIQLEGTNIGAGLSVNVTTTRLSGSSTQSYLTDANGTIRIPCNAQYRGDVAYYAEIGNAHDVIGVEDYTLYATVSQMRGARDYYIKKIQTVFTATESYLRVEQNSVRDYILYTYNNDVTKCRISLTIQNDSIPLSFIATDGITPFTFNLVKGDVINLIPYGDGGFDIEQRRGVAQIAKVSHIGFKFQDKNAIRFINYHTDVELKLSEIKIKQVLE